MELEKQIPHSYKFASICDNLAKPKWHICQWIGHGFLRYGHEKVMEFYNENETLKIQYRIALELWLNQLISHCKVIVSFHLSFPTQNAVHSAACVTQMEQINVTRPRHVIQDTPWILQTRPAELTRPANVCHILYFILYYPITLYPWIVFPITV